MSAYKLKPLFCALVFLAMPLTAFGQAPSFLNQVFDFEDLSTAGFNNGGAAGPFVVPDANGNNVLEIQTSGAANGPGNALVVFNNAITGDFSTATSVLFDATNPNPTDLNIRFAINDAGASNVFISDDIVLSAGATDSLSFLLDPAFFAQPAGVATFDQTISNISQIRILSNPVVALGGGNGLPQGGQVFDLGGNLIAGTLQVDNFVVSTEVNAVPEPSFASLLLGLVGAVASRRRKRS